MTDVHFWSPVATAARRHYQRTCPARSALFVTSIELDGDMVTLGDAEGVIGRWRVRRVGDRFRFVTAEPQP